MSLPTHINLEIVTPDRPLVQEQVDEVEIPAAGGYMGVLPGHTPLLATLHVGQLWYRKAYAAEAARDEALLAVADKLAAATEDVLIKTHLKRIQIRHEEITTAKLRKPSGRMRATPTGEVRGAMGVHADEPPGETSNVTGGMGPFGNRSIDE